MSLAAAAADAASAAGGSEDEVSGLRRERDFLLGRVAAMEAESAASRARATQLQRELGSLAAAKRDLEEQLRVAVSQKSELNSRIHDLHLQFVSGRQAAAAAAAAAANAANTANASHAAAGPPPAPSSGTSSVASSVSASGASYSPLATEFANRRLSLAGSRSSLPPPARSSPSHGSPARGGGGVAGTGGGTGAGRARRASDSSAWPARPASRASTASAPASAPAPALPSAPPQPLGALDGIVSTPHLAPRAAPDPRKVAAILKEFNPVELQRHLLTTTVENKALHKELLRASRSAVHLEEQLDKVKDENDDLKFQLEEKKIELEGTRARVRVLERLQQKTAPAQDITVDPPILPPDATTNPILPLLALPMPAEDNVHHSSSTESAHDHGAGSRSTEAPADAPGEAKKDCQPQSPKKRPSKIPLPGMKTYCSPKPPSGKSTVGKRKDSPSGRNKPDSSSLSGRAVRDASWKSRSDSVSSLSGGRNRESPGGGRSSSLSARHNSRESLSGNKGRDSLNSKKYNSDSISSNRTRDASQNSLSSNSSNKRDSMSSRGKEVQYPSAGNRKGHHPVSARRVGNASLNRGNVLDQSDQNSKVLTASDSLEPKLSSSLASNTNAELTDDVLDQPGDSFSDSLNNIPNQEPDCVPFKSSTDTVPLNSTLFEQHSVFQPSNANSTHAFPWHSSSSEYFDSINNSGSMFNNISLSRSCSYYQDQQFAQPPSDHEGLAECDSLENKDANMMDTSKTTETYSVGANSTRNIWVKLNKHSNEW